MALKKLNNIDDSYEGQIIYGWQYFFQKAMFQLKILNPHFPQKAIYLIIGKTFREGTW